MLNSKLDINQAKRFHEYGRKEYFGYRERTKEASRFLDGFRNDIIERLSLNDTVFSTLKEILQEKHRWGKDIVFVDIDVYFNEWDVEICGGANVCNDLRWTSSGIYIPLDDMVKMIADNKLGKEDFEKYWVNKKEKKMYSVPAKTFNEIVILDGETVDYIAKAVEKPIMKKDETWTHTVVFPDGIEADLKCCSASYGEGDGEPAWCEMVLFDHGCECGTCLDENFTGITGEWWVDYNDTRYYVEVRKGEYKTDCFHN